MNPFHSYESAEDRVIRITTELLTTHVAARAERTPNAPLHDQDIARLEVLARLRRGPYAETVNALILMAFPQMGQTRPIEDASPKDAS